MESIVGNAALTAIAQQDAAEKQAIDAKATSALSTANEVAGQFLTVKAAAEAATATATNAYTAAQTANATASNVQTQVLANKQAIVSEANTRGQTDTALQSQITNIVNGTTVVGKATNDANGNNIPNTYATKAELAPVATSGDYDDLTNKPTAGTNIEISVNNVISAPNVAAKTEAVGSFTLSLDPQTYELSIQAKDINGTNIGTAQTVDLPIETMVVSGSYDDATQSITLTLQNGQTITFSVAGLVAGLQTQLTFDSTPTNDSTNPVTSGGVYSALANKQNTLTFDNAPTQNSSNPVTSGGVYDALAGKQNTLSTAQLNAVNSGINQAKVNKLNNINIQFDWTIDNTNNNIDSEDLVQLIINKYGDGSIYPEGIVNSITVYLNGHTFISSNGVLVTANVLKLTSVGDTYNSDYPAGTWAAMIGTLTAIDSAGKVTRYAAEFNWGDALDVSDASLAHIILSKLVTTIPGVNDHVQYYIPSTNYAVLATTSGSNVDYYFGTYGASSLTNLVNPNVIYTDVRLEDGKFTFKCYLQSGAYSNSVGTRLYGTIAVGRKFFVDTLNIMLDKSFTYSQFSTWANANNYKMNIGNGKVKFAVEPGVEDLIAQLRYVTEDITFNFGNYTTGGITHYNGVNFYYEAYVILTISSGIHTSGNNTGAGEMYCTVDLSGFIASYS